MRENTTERKQRRQRDAAKKAACNFADGVEPRLLRHPNHLMSAERAYLGRTWRPAGVNREESRRRNKGEPAAASDALELILKD